MADSYVDEYDDLEDFDDYDDEEDEEYSDDGEPYDDDDDLDDLDDDDLDDETPEPKMTAPTIILCGLNILAVCAFAYLLTMNFSNRRKWTKAVMLHDLALLGLPLEKDNSKFTADRVSRPKVIIDGEDIKVEHNKRRGERVKKFQNVNEYLKYTRVRPNQLRYSNGKPKKILEDMFTSLGVPVATLEREVSRVQQLIHSDITKAAKNAEADLNGASDAKKRGQIQNLLLPLAHTTQELQTLNKRIQAAKGNELKHLFIDAGQRKMLVELLTAMQNYWPLKKHEKVLQTAADSNKVTLAQLGKLLNDRFDDAAGDPKKDTRSSIEKRRDIAFLLTAIAHVKKPDFKTPLYGNGKQRAEVVVGVLDYSIAVDTYATVLKRTVSDFTQRILALRDGSFNATKTGKVYVRGFVDEYQQAVSELQQLVADIKDRERKRTQLQQELAVAKVALAERTKQREDIVREILTKRDQTAKLVSELRQLERQLFLAQIELANAGRQNRDLEIGIRKAEKTLGVRPLR